MSDVLIIGAGIVGLTLAREIKHRNPGSRITVLEKESTYGVHSSGRNSGVLHSGIYYPSDSLKAKVCVTGMRELRDYCLQHGLPIKHIGKVIVPTREEDGKQLDLLLGRGRANGATVELIDEQQLRELEPEARSATGQALWSPDTAVIDPMAVLKRLVEELTAQGVSIRYGQSVRHIDATAAVVHLGDGSLAYGHLLNAAGLFADKVAHAMGAGKHYTLLPFKGIYYKLSPTSGLDIRHLIYPVPDLRVPFLGVHYTSTVAGKTYLGPTAVPAWGRENYRGLQGIRLRDAGAIGYRLAKQYALDRQGFRLLARIEGRRYFKKYFAEAARALTPRLRDEHLLACDKVGIRAQLLDTEKNELVSDFVVERGERSTHILNAISPAFTSSFAFARHVVDHFVPM
ncbi:MAG: L-2-hydroxyglutarate oxidase [Pseudomonadota bacterium]|jgi:L-2-hydroxyglutarate oxidase LhgO